MTEKAEVVRQQTTRIPKIGTMKLSKSGKAVFINLVCGVSGWLSSESLKGLLDGSKPYINIMRQEPRKPQPYLPETV